MQKRARCPLCGMVVWRSQIEKSHSIDILAQNRVVRAKGRGGFKFTRSEDVGLVALVRAKIKTLYEKYFEPVFPSIAVTPRVRARASILTRPSILIVPGVSVE